MRTTRRLTSLLRKRKRPRENGEMAETDRLERQTSRLQNRHSASPAESRQRTRSGFGGPG
jgi:hypothetical protein